jgi:type II secretory pathway pseudopilin PulG
MSRLRAQDGMTLMEVLIAATVGFIVIAGTLGLLESTMRLSGGVMAKTDAMQRGRLAMDRVTQQLRSQVCLNLTTPAIEAGATADSVTFYSDFGTGDVPAAPHKRTLTFDTATGNITESVLTGAGPSGGPYTYLTAPTKSIVFENAARQIKTVGAVTTTVPFLSYYAYEETGVPPVLRTTQVLAPPLTAAQAARVARIDIAFAARPTGARDAKDSTDIEDQITVRHADPNLTVPDPMCI